MLERIRNNKAAAGMLVSALLMVILLVLQFTPFWNYGEAGESCSISSYIWFPSDHKDLESWLGTNAEGHDLNSFVWLPILVLVLSALGAVFCVTKPDAGATSLLPAGCGIAGIIAYLTEPALKLGAGWMGHLVICIVLLVLGVYGIAQWVRDLRS